MLRKHSFNINIKDTYKYIFPKSFSIYLKGLFYFISKPHKFYNKFISVLRRESIIRLYNLDYQKYLKYQKITMPSRQKQLEEINNFKFKPKISILLPTYNSPSKYLKQAIDSVINQTYSNWELCITDDASTDKKTLQLLKKYIKKDKRIKIKFKLKNTHISDTTNGAYSLATGDYIALLDHDDLIYPYTLYEYVKSINNYPYNTEVIYCDEDKIDQKNRRFDVHFKPDFSPHTLLAGNYITHFLMIKRDLFEKVGKLRVGFEGAQDYDLILRLVDKTNKIYHIPKILYSWRAIKQSTASSSGNAKSYAYKAGIKSLQSYFKRHNLKAKVQIGEGRGLYKLQFNNIKDFNNVLLFIPDLPQKTLLDDDCLKIYSYNSNQTLGYNFLQSLNNSKYKYLFIASKNFINSDFKNHLKNNIGLLTLPNLYILGNKFLNTKHNIIHTGYIFIKNKNVKHVKILDAFYNMKTGGYFNFNYSKMLRNYSAVSALGITLDLKFFKKTIVSKDFNLIKKINSYKELGIYLSYLVRLNNGFIATQSKPFILTKKLNYNLENKFETDILKKWNQIIKNYDLFYNPNLTTEKMDFSIDLKH